ncbi:Cyclin D2;1 [Hibiscus trionum]|uniref:Cyclin D21 n=1 Tax=Hibiscus trionum TaxID=183268 RepID=A0A9W7LTF0_HIBTR|nr:Cyclin D2;1 [Hibiscus trionum]
MLVGGEMDASIDFLEFRPSKIAAALVISCSGDMQTVVIDKAISSFTSVQKGRVLKCVELMKDLSFINGVATVAAQHSSASSFIVPQSPIGVLDETVVSLSYKSDKITVDPYTNSSHSSLNIKKEKTRRRRRQRRQRQQQQSFPT